MYLQFLVIVQKLDSLNFGDLVYFLGGAWNTAIFRESSFACCYITVGWK